MNQIEKEDYARFAEQFPLYEGLKERTFVITGATGLLGTCMVNCLRKLNFERKLNLSIVCIVRDKKKAWEHFYKYNGPGKPEQAYDPDEEYGDCLGFVQHDFGKDEEISRYLSVDYLIHFASPTASQYFVNHPVETMMTDFDGTAQVLRYCRLAKAESIVNVSSLEVYGSVYDDTKPLTEDQQGYIDPMQARSSYPIAKRAAECLCHAYAQEYDLPVKTARLAQTFGAGVTWKDQRVFAEFARNVIDGEDIVLHTTGELSRSYCYITDAVEAILYILLKGEDGEAYNVANEESYISIRDMAKMVCQEFNPSIQPVIELQEGMGYSPMTKLRLSCEKVHQLGWKPRYDLRTMFERLILSMKSSEL